MTNHATVAHKRKRTRITLLCTLALVAIAPACIFDQSHYEKGGTASQGASTNETSGDTDGGTPSTPDTSTATTTATSTSTAPVDAGAG